MNASFKCPPSWAGPLAGKDPWPLRFYRHSFAARCFNTQTGSIIYNRREFVTAVVDGEICYGGPCGPAWKNWEDNLISLHCIVPEDHGNRTFPTPVDLAWTDLSGKDHKDRIDLDAIFADRLVLHNLARDELLEGWLAGCSVEPVVPIVLVELNNRVVNVYMRAFVCTSAEQVPGNPLSDFRDDLVLAWTKTYGEVGTDG